MRYSALLLCCACIQGQSADAPVTPGVILVKGAWSSASDDVTPLPQNGSVTQHIYRNDYFGISYALSEQWTQRYTGPPPSDSGYLVLAQIEPSEERAASMPGHLLISAQDLFFTPLPVSSAVELLNYTSSHLAHGYRVETAPTEVRVVNHSFVRFDYMAPVSGLHWRVMATQRRCHVIQFIYTARDPKRLDALSDAIRTMELAAGDTPACIKDYASSPQRISGEEPVFATPRFNRVPVRIIIDTKGRVRHVHILSAFADQTKSIGDALATWRFKPYLINGRALEVETGVLFGWAPPATSAMSVSATAANSE